MVEYLDSRLVGSTLITWVQFSETFFENFMPHNMHECLKDYFTRLQQLSMTVAEYEARFHILAMHSTMILPTEHKSVWCFIRGLRLLFCMDTQSLVAVSRLFVDVSNFSHTMEHLHLKDYGEAIRDPINKAVIEGAIVV